MKFIHLSDLHIGKRLYEKNLLEDQDHILRQILGIIRDEKPDGILLAGDIYDRSDPSAEAVRLFDEFLFRLSGTGAEVFVISGNHDSPERIAFGGRLMEEQHVHLSPVYSGTVAPVTLSDPFGQVNVYLLPFIKPVHVRECFPDEEIASYTDAVRTAVAHMNVDPAARNLLVTHQFVTDAARSESEEISVGGTDNVDASVFAPFDYVALGHIHSPQNCSSDRIRYCGTPLKYSFSEAKDEKSVTVVEMGAKGDVSYRTVPLRPKHDLVVLKGTYGELTDRSFYAGTTYPEDYVSVILTDEDDIPDAVMKLRLIYKNLLHLDYDNRRMRASGVADGPAVEDKSPLELFSDLFEQQNGRAMTDEQTRLINELIEKLKEGAR